MRRTTGERSIATFSPLRSPKTNLNNHSIVTVIEYQGVKILSPGDNEPPSWEELLADVAFREAIRNTHVLVAPHHGRESGFHPGLFDHISPLLTIISDGKDGGHECYRSILHQVRRMERTEEKRAATRTGNVSRLEMMGSSKAVISPNQRGNGVARRSSGLIA